MSKLDDARAAVEAAHRQLEEAQKAAALAKRAEREARREEENRKVRAFRDSLEEEFDTKAHPKAGLLWDIAWDEGHSYGFEQVRYWYERLLDLVRP